MFEDVIPYNLIGIAIIVTFCYLGMKTRNALMQLLSFIIVILVGASLAGFFDLVQSVVAIGFAGVALVILLALVLVYMLVSKIGSWMRSAPP